MIELLRRADNKNHHFFRRKVSFLKKKFIYIWPEEENRTSESKYNPLFFITWERNE